MKLDDQLDAYSVYVYLEKTGELEYLLHILLCMPENYTLTGLDYSPPRSLPLPPPPEPHEVDYIGIRFRDETPLDEDKEACNVISQVLNVQPGQPEKKVLQVYYLIENEAPCCMKIPKKPIARVDYLLADNLPMLGELDKYDAEEDV